MTITENTGGARVTYGLTAQNANRKPVLSQLIALSLTPKNCEDVFDTAVKESHCEVLLGDAPCDA